MERQRNTLESEIYPESLISMAVDEVHCVTEWGSSSNDKMHSPFRLFRLWYFHYFCNFNYAILTPGDYVISMEFLAVNRRRLSSRFSLSGGSE